MLTGRDSNIFEITDEPLRDDDLPESAAGSDDDCVEPKHSDARRSGTNRSRLLALGCLIAGGGALVAVLPRDDERPESPVETHASAPSQRDAHAHVEAMRTPRIPREVRQPGSKRAESRRTSALVVRKHVAPATTPAPRGPGQAVVPLAAGSGPSDARPRVLAAPYEEFGFER